MNVFGKVKTENRRREVRFNMRESCIPSYATVRRIQIVV